MATFHEIVNTISIVLNVIGSLIIIFGVVVVLIDFLKKEVFSKSDLVKQNEAIRIKLGSYLVLGLELFIAGDIVKTIITPTWQSLGMLGTIVVIRTILNYSLTKELRSAAK